MSRLDRYGDPIEEHDGAPDDCGDCGNGHPADCDGGWRGEDHLGRPRPCLECKPHLKKLITRKKESA